MGDEHRRLPAGRHNLTREEVFASQRGRLSVAALEIVAERGYHHATVTDIVRRACVSRRSFYAIFDGKDSCFTAGMLYAIDAVERSLSEVAKANQAASWRELVELTLGAYLELVRAEPVLTRALHVESLVAGPGQIASRAKVARRLAQRMRAACQLGVDCGDLTRMPPDEIFDFIIGGIDDRIRHCLNTRGAEHAPQLADELCIATLMLFKASDNRDAAK